MFGEQPTTGSPEDATHYGAGGYNGTGSNGRHHGPRYSNQACVSQDTMQGDYNVSYPFHPHPSSFRARGNPRIATWMRPRFGSTNVNGYGNNYGSRGYYGNGRGCGMPRGGMRDPRESHHFGQHYGSYRNGRRHPRHGNHQSQSYCIPVNCYPSQHLNQAHEEYVPFPCSPPLQNPPYTPSNLQYLTQSTATPGPVYVPNLTSVLSVPSKDGGNEGEKDEKANTPLPQDIISSNRAVQSDATTDQRSPNCDIAVQISLQSENLRPMLVDGSKDCKVRRNSTDSSDSASVCGTSESSSDGFDNDDSGVSTFEPSEEDEKLMMLTENRPKDSSGEDLSDVREPTFLFDGDFLLVYIEAKSAYISDGKGNTSVDEVSCYGVWFGPRNSKNFVDEVPLKYNQERGKSGYILGVIKALAVIRDAENTRRVHLVMGSSFVMNNLSSWNQNLKKGTSPCTNWTEWKHLKEISELLGNIDGMVLKFSLAHPREELFVQCKEAVASYWEDMKKRRIIEASNAAYPMWNAPAHCPSSDDQYVPT